MCDNKNELHKSEYDKSKDNTSTRLDLDITETTDSYPEFDFLDLLRNLQIKGKKAKHKVSSEESTNKSNLFSEEDSDVEALARLYEEKYGTCNDYAELGEGYDEEDSFIDNSDAVNDLVPSGIQTEFGGFYINRGKLNFVKEDNSSSSTSEDVDKFLAHNRLNARKIISDDENEEKESCKTQSNNHSSSNNNNNVLANNSNNIISSNSNNNSSNSNTNHNNNHCSNNNNGSLHSNIIKNRKRSGEFQHKSKKIRKTATPKIPEHLLHKKPFPGSLEYRKNINEFKKNRLKTVETDKKPTVTNLIVNSSNNSNNNNNNHNNNNNNNNSENANNNHSNNYSTVNSSGNNTGNEDDNDNDKKEISITKKKPQPVKERDGASEVIEAVATGANMADKQQSSSSSETSESSSSDSESESSEDASVEKEKVSVQKPVEEVPHKNAAMNGSISKEITAKSFAQLSDSLKELVAKIVEISKDEKNKVFNNKLNPLLLSLDDRLRELPLTERNAVLEHVAEILQMKKDNITKRTKKLLVLQEETKMSTPLRKLKEAVASMMPLLESSYFNEYTKAAGTSPQIYAELSRYYWSIDPSSLPQRKFPWSDELRSHLREIVQYRKNCYYIVRPRKESLVDYIRNFLEAKVKPFWPKEWMTVDILLEEAQVASPRQPEDKAKVLTKMMAVQNSSNVTQKKTSPNVPTPNVSNRKQGVCGGPTISTSTTSPSTSRKPAQGSTKNSEVKSILIPRKVPQGSSAGTTPPKPNFSASSSVSSHQNTQQGNRLQVTLNRPNVQDYLDRISGSQTSISRGSSQQQISQNRSQQSVSPNRLPKTSSPNSVLNPSVVRQNVSKNSSTNNVNKSLSVRSCGNSQSVLKTIEIHSNPVSVSKSSPNAVTISPVNESLFKDITPSPEVLNLTKNSSVYISKVKDCTESKSNRSSSPSIAFPLPSGITISPTNASPSTFLAKPQKPSDKINVSITKQESAMSLTKEKRESILNINLKREGPFQNIPDCISVTSKSVPNERHKYEHVRKRALQEYHQQQHSPERLKPEEKKLKTEDSLLTDMEMKDDRLDDKNFSKIFDSVIAKTSETVRQSESVICTKYSNANMESVDSGGGGGGGGGGGLSAKGSSMGSSQYKSNNPSKTREVRTPKDKPYYLSKSELNLSDDLDERNETSKEQRVQMEMDRVMQNLVELSREKNPEYEYESQHLGYPSSNPSTFKSSNFQEAYQKMLFK